MCEIGDANEQRLVDLFRWSTFKFFGLAGTAGFSFLMSRSCAAARDLSSLGIGCTSTVGLLWGGGGGVELLDKDVLVISNELIEVENVEFNLGCGTGMKDESKSGRIDW